MYSPAALTAAAIAVSLAYMLVARSYVGSGWGQILQPLDGEQVAFGLIAQAPDSLFYLSLVEQARLGYSSFSVLLTTEPHDALLFNPYFFCVGLLARALGWTSALAYNISGVVAASAAVVFVLKCAAELEFGWRARIGTAFLLVFGSGLTWISRLGEKFGSFALPRGVDWTFMDLFPSEAFLVYPYHACAHAGLAFLMWLILRAERRGASTHRDNGLNSPTSLLALGATALLLGAIRPYEPVLLLGVYGVRTMAAWFDRTATDKMLCVRIWVALAVGFLPPIAYAAWVSRQPVWLQFSSNAMQLSQGRLVLLVGFAIFWLLAGIGCRVLPRPWSGRAALLVWWWLASVVLLLGLNSGWVKLTGGCNLAAALLGGLAIERLWRAEILARRPARRALCLGLLMGASASTHAFLLRSFKALVPSIDPQVYAIGETLRKISGNRLPSVICEPAIAAPLSGLFGCRTYAGHALLTPAYDAKARELESAGVTPGEKPIAPSANRSDLRALLQRAGVEFAVIAASRRALDGIGDLDGWQPQLVQSRWTLLRNSRLAPPAAE